MSTVIRDGVIRISIQQGTVELKVPDLRPVIEQRRQEAQAVAEVQRTTQSMAAVEAAAASQNLQLIRQQNAAYKEKVAALNEIGRAAMAEAGGRNKWTAGLESMSSASKSAADSEAAELERVNQLILADRVRRHQRQLYLIEEEKQAAIRAAREQEDARSRVFSANRSMSEQSAEQTRQRVNQTSEAFGQLTSAAALFLTDTDKGFQDFIRTLAIAQGGLNLIRASLVLAPALAPVIAAVSALAVAWRLVADATKDAEQKAKDYAERTQATTREGMQNRIDAVDRMREFSTELERQQVLQERITAAQKVGEAAEYYKSTGKNMDVGSGGIFERQVIVALDADKERLQLAQQARDKELERLDILKRQTEETERSAKLEAEKLRTFQAQIGALGRGDQRRLANIAQEIESKGVAGLSRSELDIASRLGGERGQNLAQNELARRFQQTAGADVISRVFGNEQESGPSEAIQAIERQRRDTIDAYDTAREEIKASATSLLEILSTVRRELSKAQSAMLNQ